MRRVAIVLLLLLLPLVGGAQETLPAEWRSYIEQLTEEGEETLAEELLEVFEMYREEPLNLNDTVGGLAPLPFVDEYQQDCLRAYIALYGQLLSVEELYAVTGFDSITIALLRPLVRAEKAEGKQRLTLAEVVRYGRSNLVLGTSGTVEQARGYRDSIYEGNNLRMLWRYYFKYKDRVQLQLSGDKDPGEAFFAGSQPQGFDFYGYSLMVNDVGRFAPQGERSLYVKRAVLGQYHLQFGQGLTLWSGYGSRLAYGGRVYRYAQGMRPSGAFTEYGYLQGLATTLALGRKWDLSLFYSFVRRDATLPRKAATDSTIDWVQSLYNAGYHRTQTEIGKRDQLGERLFGGHLEFHQSHLRVGMTAVATQFDRDIIPATYYYNDNAFRGNENYNAGLDVAYRYRRLLFFGEGALCVNALDSLQPNVSPAALLGGEWAISSNHRLSGQLRYYSPTYHNHHSSTLGQNGYPQNEAGGALYYQGLLPLGITTTLMADFFWFPHEKYLVYAPSRGREYRVDLTKPFRRVKGLSVRLRYRYKERGKNVIPSTMVDGAYRLEQTYRHQLQGDLEWQRGAWRWVSRLAYAYYHGDVTEGNGGWLLYQDLQYRPQQLPLTVAARVALFDVDDYEARIYTVESDFIYQYNGGVFQNEGCRLYLLLRYDINKYWNVGLKYGVTAYSDKDTFGSSYDLIDANHRQQWRIQLRLKW